MIPVTVKILSDCEDVQDLDVEGYVPFADSPLAVTPVFINRAGSMQWEVTERWAITLRHTGYTVGPTFATKEEAWAVLQKCDPTYPAWRLCIGEDGDAATIACKVMMRGALNHGTR